MDKTTLLAVHDFSRDRLIALLDAIEKKSPDTAKVLAWRPGLGRAHIGWQAMHCAATHDRYLHSLILNTSPSDEALVAGFAGGSTPADDNVPTMAAIREKLTRCFAKVRNYIEQSTPEEHARMLKLPNGTERSVGESLVLLAWHEAHHQGQIHLTWNMYKAAHPAA